MLCRDIDALAAYDTAGNLIGSQAPTRYAVRQVLDQELQASIARREKESRLARLKGDGSAAAAAAAEREKEAAGVRAKLEREALLGRDEVKDFFGRVIVAPARADGDESTPVATGAHAPRKVWVTFHEGLNNAVRKPISMGEFMRGL